MLARAPRTGTVEDTGLPRRCDRSAATAANLDGDCLLRHSSGGVDGGDFDLGAERRAPVQSPAQLAAVALTELDQHRP